MKPKTTYREITLIIGILVALLVAFTLWMASTQNDLNSAPIVDLRHSLQTASLKLIKIFVDIRF